MVTEIVGKGTVGIETEAFGADPSQIDKVYQFRYRVVSLGDVIPSHNDNLVPNENYPTELQPRLRDRAASRAQILNIAQNINPRALLQDSGFIDTGPMIVGDDLVVESGNGRVMALRKASQDFPEQYSKYTTMLSTMADRFGIDKDKLAKIDKPVLVRERVTPVDRVKFAAEANVGAVMSMSPYEQALQDAGRLSSNIISNLAVGEEQTIDQALRMRSNDDIIKHFTGNIPATERAAIADERGAINQQGIDRLKLAIFAKTYTGDAGKRLVRIFGESADPVVKSIENAMFASLPDMAKAEGLIDAKQRDSDLSIAPDMAEVVDTYASLKATGLTIKDYLAQQAMFEDRLNPFQRKLLEHLDDTARKPKLVREMLRNTAEKIVDAPPKGQIGMMGLAPLTKEAMVYGVINRQRAEIGKPAFPPTSPTPASKELEKPGAGGTESAGRLGQGVGFRTGEDSGLAARTSVQVGLAGLGKESAQVKMLEEFGGAPGAGGKKETLIDIETEEAKEAAKPLPGQVVFKETEAKFAEEAASTETITEREARRKVKPVTTEVTIRIKELETEKAKLIQTVRKAKQKFESTKVEKRIAEINNEIDAITTRPVTSEATVKSQAEYKRRMQPFLDKADAEIKRVNDVFMAGKTSLTENQAQRDAINLKLDKRANKIRKEMSFPEALLSEVTPKEPTRGGQAVSRRPHSPEIVGSTPAPATKPTRRADIVSSKSKNTVDELRKIHDERTPQAQALDNALTHKATILPDHPKVKAWVRDQGTSDILGIDSPARIKKPTLKTPKPPKPKNALKSTRHGKLYRTKMKGGTALSRRPLRAQRK